jgi:hypothetical protein
MNPRVRVIRFARVAAPAGLATGEIIAHVLLDEKPALAGRIGRSSMGWHYQLGDHSPSGLASSHSRQDLERQIVLYHLGSLPTATLSAELREDSKSWFAQAI